jgi:hypothetical protein
VNTEPITDFAALRPGCSYTITHRAGGRVVSHTGEFEFDIWFATSVRHTTSWGKEILVRRRFSVYPEEFISAVELPGVTPPPPPARPRRRVRPGRR